MRNMFMHCVQGWFDFLILPEFAAKLPGLRYEGAMWIFGAPLHVLTANYDPKSKAPVV